MLYIFLIFISVLLGLFIGKIVCATVINGKLSLRYRMITFKKNNKTAIRIIIPADIQECKNILNSILIRIYGEELLSEIEEELQNDV